MASLGLAQLLLWPLRQLSGIPGLAALARASAQRLDRVISAEKPGADVEPFTPDGLTAPLPRLDRGQLVGIVAENSDQLLQQLRTQCPHALFDPHGTVLFAGTLRENVELGMAEEPQGSDHEALLQSSLEAACLQDVLTSLPRGLDSEIGDNGMLLSGGQRQRVGLARALAVDAESLVLQEPSSALDSVTEADVAQRLKRMRQGKSTVIFTVSPGLLTVCDVVLFSGPGASPDSSENGGWQVANHERLLDDPHYRRAVEL